MRRPIDGREMASDARYQVVALSAETAEPLPVFWALTPSSGRAPAAHVCPKNGQASHLRVVNNSSERIEVKIFMPLGQRSLSLKMPGVCPCVH